MRLLDWLKKRKDNLQVGTIRQEQVGNQTLDIPEGGDIVTVMFWGHPGTEFTTQWWWGWDQN